MRGMQKIRRGKSFTGVMKYVDGDGHGKLIAGNLAGKKIREIAREFQKIRGLRPDIEKCVWHNSLRLPIGEKISHEKWSEIAMDYISEMGLEGHQFTAWQHDDEDGQHIHIVANRIGLNGSVFLGQNENLISTRVIHQLELKHKLQITKGVEYTEEGKIKMRDKKSLGKNEIEMALRKGEQPPRMQLQQGIRAALDCKPDVDLFMKRLQTIGIAAIPNVASTGKMNGFSFEINGIKFKASDLGDEFKWAKLSQRMGYDQNRDGKKLAEQFRTFAGNKENEGGIRTVGDTPASGIDEAAEGGNGPADRAIDSAVWVGLSPTQNESTDPQKFGGDQQSSDREIEGNKGAEKDGLGFDGIDRLDFIASAFPVVQPNKDGLQTGKQTNNLPSDLTTKAVLNQLSAFNDVEFFEVGIQSKNGAMNIQKMTADQVIKAVPRLKRDNAGGANIFIRPDRMTEHPYLLLDDLEFDAIDELRREVFGISALIESSPNNWQAVIKYAASLSPAQRKIFERALQKRFNSDVGAADGQHFFRLAGFTNRKIKHQQKDGRFPFCKLIQFTKNSKMSEGAVNFLNIAKNQIDLDSSKVKDGERLLEREIGKTWAGKKGNLSAEFASAHQKLKIFYGKKYDPSVADFSIAKRFLKAGWALESVADGIKSGSPNLQERKVGHIEDYINLTVEKAQKAEDFQFENFATSGESVEVEGLSG